MSNSGLNTVFSLNGLFLHTAVTLTTGRFPGLFVNASSSSRQRTDSGLTITKASIPVPTVGGRSADFYVNVKADCPPDTPFFASLKSLSYGDHLAVHMPQWTSV